MERAFQEFLIEYEKKVVELSKKANLAYFNASISGKAEDYKNVSELQLELEKIYSNKDDFAKVKEFKNSDKIKDEILSRQLDRIYSSYAGSQIDEDLLKDIIELSTKVEKHFSTFRADLDGNKLTDNEIDKILDQSTDSKKLEKVWRASKQIGNQVSDQVLKLVKMRNQSAINLGFKNYHEMSLQLSEQNSEELDKLFDELNELTKDEFTSLKAEMDQYLFGLYKIEPEQLMPWHYQDKFFQQGPKIYDLNLDKYFEGKDLVKMTKDYFKNINLEVDDLIDKSDLFEKEGKYQHAYCTAIDKDGDIRVVCNLKSNQKWMATMLHEFGHAAYDKYVSAKLPWTLREHSHIFTTEAIAMLFGRFALNPNWLQENIGLTEQEKEKIFEVCKKSLKLEQLIFSRWVQVVYRFEQKLYENPDQDLNSLWWDLVEKYQKLNRPKGNLNPDWASKIHIALYPAYYHNYMLGELLASQLYYYISEKVLKLEKNDTSFSNYSEVGNYLKNLFFSYGALFKWDKLIKHATGSKLSAKYYARQFVNK